MIEVMVYLLPITLVKEKYDFIFSYVSEKRRKKALRYKNETDRLLSFGAGYLLKKYLPSDDYKETISGKPYLENGPNFNISHSGEYVVLAIHPCFYIGVDIERIDEDKLLAIKYVLNENEKEITDLDTLFQIWSNKESIIKCISTGIRDIKKVDGYPLEGIRVINNESYYVKSMIYNGYSLSLTVKSKEPFNINILKEKF